MLDVENKKMEEKLKTVQNLMAAEQMKKSASGQAGSSGSMWRSSNQTSKHAKDVLEQHKTRLTAGMKPTMPKMPSAASAKADAAAIHRKAAAGPPNPQ